MSVPSRHILKAIVARWDEAGLDNEFINRSSGYSGFAPLSDGEAAPGQPWPYCVFRQLDSGGPEARMTGRSNASGTNQRHQRVPIMFEIYAKPTDASSAKEVAADLAGHVLNAYGDDENGQHLLTLDVGEHFQTQMQNEYGLKLDDDEHQWTIVYDFLIDTPVAVG